MGKKWGMIQYEGTTKVFSTLFIMNQIEFSDGSVFDFGGAGKIDVHY